MKKDIYFFGNHIPSLSSYCRLATETFTAVSLLAQLAIKGNSGDDDDPKYFVQDRLENIMPFSIYNFSAFQKI